MPGFFDKLLGKDSEGKARSLMDAARVDPVGAIPKLIIALEDEASEVRKAAATALEFSARKGNDSAVKALTRALEDRDVEVRKAAAQTLGEFLAMSPNSPANTQAKDALIGLLGRDSDAGVIKNAVVALSRAQDPATIPRMVEALRNTDKTIITMAIDAINDLQSTDVRIEMKKALRSIL